MLHSVVKTVKHIEDDFEIRNISKKIRKYYENVWSNGKK